MRKDSAKPCDQADCGAQIVFLRNIETGRTVPVDAETVEAGDLEFDRSRHVSHFRTCKNP